MRYVSRRRYLISFLVPQILSFTFFLFGPEARRRSDQFPILGVTIVIALPSLAAILVLLYKMWKLLPRDAARMIPRDAVIYMLIPIYNLYKLFHVIWGWSKDYNRYIATMRSDTPSHQLPWVSQRLALTLCILAVLSHVSLYMVLKYSFTFPPSPTYLLMHPPLLLRKPTWFLGLLLAHLNPVIWCLRIILWPIFISQVCSALTALHGYRAAHPGQ